MHRSALALALLTLQASTAPAQTKDDATTPREEIVVRGERRPDFNARKLSPNSAMGSAPDTAALLERVPGAHVIENGPLSAQVQYRGMFGPRMSVLIDGIRVHPGGPNWMDPPLHYLPGPELESLELVRGISSVSLGAQSLGGSVLARSKRGRFAEGEDPEFHGDGSISGRSADGSYSVGGLLSLATRVHRLEIRGSRAAGDDLDFGDGTLPASEHERDSYGVGYGLRVAGHELDLVYRHSETGATGNPSLPMDIAFLDTEILSAGYRGEWAGIPVRAKLYYTDVDHGMNNFGLRPVGAARRFVAATGRGLGFDLRTSLRAGGGKLAFGIDGHRTRDEMEVLDPDAPMFFVRQFDDATSDRTGAFIEWKRRFQERFSLEVGVRYDRVEMDADPVDALPAQMLPAPGRLRDRSNAASRERGDDDVDWVLKLHFEPTQHLRVELAAARKTRSPSHLERYLWLPLEVSAGLADGNNYVGNIGLDPEISHQVELGVDWRSDRFFVSPRGFYRSVDDYIQGTAETDMDVVMVSTSNGDATPLRFRNVEAELYGVDAEWGMELGRGWELAGLLSWVRGKRRDIDDNLYRIAPLSGAISLSVRGETWSARAEGAFTAKQRHLSRSIVLDEPSTSNDGSAGTGLLGLQATWSPTRSPLAGTTLKLGVANLLDKSYADPTSGFNRVAGPDVAVGARLPGPGRSFYLRATRRW